MVQANAINISKTELFAKSIFAKSSFLEALQKGLKNFNQFFFLLDKNFNELKNERI